MDRLNKLDVYYHDRKVGTMALYQNRLAAFAYSDEWLQEGFSISPFSLPLEKRVFMPKIDPFEELFGVFADSLPDGWGRLLVDRLMRKNGLDPRTIGSLEKLAIVGNTGMGALTYRPTIPIEPVYNELKEDALASVPTGTVGTTASPDETAKSSTANKADELSPTYFMTPSIKDDNTNGTLSYSIYVWNKTGYELFSSDDARAQNYAQTINGFADKFGSSVKVYDMIVPNHTEMGLPQRLKDSDAPSTSQADNIKAAYAALSDKVTPINCYNRLAEHNTDYIYFKSDHHWTGLGAYYAYTAFADTNDLPVLSLDDCEEQKIDGFTGSFTNSADGLDSDTVSYWKFPYNVTMDITQADGSSASYDSPYYEAAEGGSNTYGVFIMGDNALTVLKSASENAAAGKKIAVVKESYGNAFVPYLTNNYEEVHVIDFRYFKQNLVDYCKTNGIDEVLFMNGVMSANTQVQLDSMSGLFN